jgi:nicotinate-nucleotide adenylyltransferase
MIGIFGGTFDPIHYGHLRPALDVQQALALSELRFMPLNIAVHREQPRVAATQRREMVEAAIANEPSFRVDDRELSREGRSYTVDTLISLRQELGDDLPICLLVGGDAFNGFFDWHRPQDILNLAHLVVMQRPGVSLQRDPELRSEVERRRVMRHNQLQHTPAGHIWFKTVTQLDVSSTRIRQMLAAGHSPRYLLPDAVLDIIERDACYGVQTERAMPAHNPVDQRAIAGRPMPIESANTNPEGK